MTYTAVIEIPKNSDRRIHKAIGSGEFVDFGPIQEKIPVNQGKMPVAYGFIKDTFNPGEGDEVDVLVFSEKALQTKDEVTIEIFGMLVREDGDHKVLAADRTTHIRSVSEIPEELWDLITHYFSTKYRIVKIEDKLGTEKYLKESATLV